MFSDDLRWRAIALLHVYGIHVTYVSDVLGPTVRTLQRWYSRFKRDGVVREDRPRQRTASWPPHVLKGVKEYVKGHPTFYLEELQAHLRLVRLERSSRERHANACVPQEVATYKAKLAAIYSCPEQMLFIDETSKDGRHAFRRYAWSERNVPAIVKLPFSRGNRVSCTAALDHTGFIAWRTTTGTFTRGSLHDAFVSSVVPLLNPWPLPRSIVIVDNAKIHMYPELEEVIHMAGARLLFLPPYAPHLNPIEFGFGRLKAWIQKNANLVFPLSQSSCYERQCSIAVKRLDFPASWYTVDTQP